MPLSEKWAVDVAKWAGDRHLPVGEVCSIAEDECGREKNFFCVGDVEAVLHPQNCIGSKMGPVIR